MKVMLLKQYNIDPTKALALVDYPMPQPSEEEVLVEIYAASINPIDARIRSGYGKAIFSEKTPLPIILGRDFSGVIIKVGANVEEYREGDSVFGVVSPFRVAGMKQGSHAKYVCVPISEIIKKPNNIDYIQAASLPYVALTTYSALISQAGMHYNDYKGKKVFVSAGAGGIGSYAIQFLKAMGAYIVTSCSSKNIEYVCKLGADEVIDYEKESAITINDCDIAYDLLGKSNIEPMLSCLKKTSPDSSIISGIKVLLDNGLAQLESADTTWTVPSYKKILKDFDIELAKLLPYSAKYISIVGPMMPLTDSKGLHAGMQQFVSDTLKYKAFQASEFGRYFNYSFFEPNAEGLRLLVEHIESGKIDPCVSQIFSLTQAPEAHRAIETGHTRGKIVFDMSLVNKDNSTEEIESMHCMKH
ncbi:zinc-binding dehydrogenase [Rickettsiella endosymbiont of Dermanyssus gallinae]|uniref:zinc-binding dehydrogenase n=1 Tax=Rickettsiella endosymbiont of Dermanyssus gallinae TaxID=2856608 RepID=UPI001C53150C|nr:zinc-binding dehydrogenase [Rickettsiella endosymbiont of Dermanyssus gallinae]